MGEMHGARRVITFCLLTAVLPTVLLIIPLYLRHSLYADVSYEVAESDVVEVIDGISPLFCQEQILRMNSTFRAFQLPQMPPLSHHKKHIKLRKSMDLPDDTVEYWGFYLLAGSKVTLMACSRYDGAGILVVRGEKTLKTCNVMESQLTHVKYQKNKNSHDLVKKFVNNVNELPKTQVLQFNQSQNHKTQHQMPIETQNKTRNIDEIAEEIKEFIVNYNNSDRNQKVYPESVKSSGELKLSRDRNTQIIDSLNLTTIEKQNIHSKLFHSKDMGKKGVRRSLTDNLSIVDDENSDFQGHPRPKEKRNTVVPGHILDAGVGHGGNANITELPEIESSDSSFEESLLKCYEGQYLVYKDIELSLLCSKNYSLENFKVETIHIQYDGYYYFIFYSDNDHHLNPVHAEFDLFKTTYEHTNYTRGCVNATECRFPISLGGKEIVIVEVPTHDGIEHEDGDTSILTSSCYPRMSVYAIFPVAVLFLILGCAFL